MYTLEQIINSLSTKIVSKVPTFPAYLQETLPDGALTEDDFFTIVTSDSRITDAIYSKIVTDSASIFLNVISDNKFRVINEIQGEQLLGILETALEKLNDTNSDVVREIKSTTVDNPPRFFDSDFINNI
jgi:hypothetical protein